MKGGLSEDTERLWVMDHVKDPKNTYCSLAQVCPANGRWAILCAMTLGRGGIEHWRASLNLEKASFLDAFGILREKLSSRL